jgi:predicted ATP-grasp superfamily ATP-dependent carboligase
MAAGRSRDRMLKVLDQESAALGPGLHPGRRVGVAFDPSTPVMLLGGRENALAVTRNLGRLGVRVRVSNAPGSWAMDSRFCAESLVMPADRPAAEHWRELLLGPASSRFHGQVVFACNDPALEFVAVHRDELRTRYRIVDSDPALQLAILDKQKTIDLARRAGVPAPNYWSIARLEDAGRLRGKLQFPVMVKPINTHAFAKAFGRKLFIIERGFDELQDKVRLAIGHGMDVMVAEMIPGPDSLLVSYNTFIDSDGRTRFEFTKRVFRRYPKNRGSACYHITEWIPDVAEMGRRFFAGIGFRGIGNVEFKRDPRDGKLKVIESNARFVATHELFVRAGAPSDLLVYCYLTDQPVPVFEQYKQFLRMWYPGRDYRSFRELHALGELSFREWLASLMHRQVLPVFSLSDPLPGINFLRRRL